MEDSTFRLRVQCARTSTATMSLFAVLTLGPGDAGAQTPLCSDSPGEDEGIECTQPSTSHNGYRHLPSMHRHYTADFAGYGVAGHHGVSRGDGVSRRQPVRPHRTRARTPAGRRAAAMRFVRSASEADSAGDRATRSWRRAWSIRPKRHRGRRCGTRTGRAQGVGGNLHVGQGAGRMASTPVLFILGLLKEEIVMSDQDAYERILASFYEAMLDDTPLAGHLGPDRRGLRYHGQCTHGRRRPE